MSDQKALFVYTQESLSLASALRAFFAAVDCQPAALVYAPRRCLFARVEANGDLRSPDPRADFEDAYEVRAFCEKAELRWRSDSQGATKAVVLSNGDLDLKSPWCKMDAKEVTDVIGQTYLLWGEGTGKREGVWSQLATARIGALWVPVPNVPEHDRVLLKATEYLTADKVHGNTYVFEERLTGLEIDKGSQS
jgi:CRISPR-associated protein (TIGR03984 family)